jgi:hypothetical protein
MTEEDKRLCKTLFLGWASSLLIVSVMVLILDNLMLYLFPSLRENLAFQRYQDELLSFVIQGWRPFFSCILIPVVYWLCGLVPKLVVKKFLWRKWLRRELETEQSFTDTIQQKWWRELALETPLHGILEYRYRDQLIEQARMAAHAEAALRPPFDQCDILKPPEQYCTTSSTISIITLSDHTSTLLRQAEQVRKAAYSAALERYDHERERIAQLKTSKGEALRSACRDQRTLGKYRAKRDWEQAMQAALPTAPRLQAAGEEELAWAAGNTGEELVMEELKSRLVGMWTLLKGYKTRKGEIDLVAVGPSGVVALEVKYLNGFVHCEGDQWHRDKYDKQGNLVESGLPIEDGGGRAPSRQLNEAADALQAILSRAGILVDVVRVVVLSHDKSRIGTLRNQNVDRICRTRDLDLALFCRGRCHGDWIADMERTVFLIRQDHADHKKPRVAVTSVVGILPKLREGCEVRAALSD